MMTFSITGSQIFLADFVIFTKSKRKTAYRFIVHNTMSYLMDTPNLRRDEVSWETVPPLTKTSNCGYTTCSVNRTTCRDVGGGGDFQREKIYIYTALQLISKPQKLVFDFLNWSYHYFVFNPFATMCVD